MGRALMLGLIQGLTEFLPVSSSGHLVLGKAILGVESQGVVVEVALHFATFLAVLTMLRGLIGSLAADGTRAAGAVANGRLTPGDFLRTPAIRTVLFVVLGTIPAALAGVLLEPKIEPLFGSPRDASFLLLVTGGILWATRYVRASPRQLGGAEATLVGLAQAVAILPGISRSGITIATALCRGVEEKRAAEFSFLLALPTIFGAAVLELPHIVDYFRAEDAAGQPGVLPLLVGMLAAYVSGCVAIHLLFGSLRRGFFPRFAFYCWGLGLVGIILTRG
jgi:undecaprenyl-diphosphatase